MKPGPGDSVKRGAVMEGVDRPRNLNGALAVTILFVLVMATVSCLNSSTGDREVRIGIVAYSDEEVERISTLNAAGMAAGEVNERGGVQAGGNSYRISLVIEEVKGGVPEESWITSWGRES